MNPEIQVAQRCAHRDRFEALGEGCSTSICQASDHTLPPNRVFLYRCIHLLIEHAPSFIERCMSIWNMTSHIGTKEFVLTYDVDLSVTCDTAVT